MFSFHFTFSISFEKATHINIQNNIHQITITKKVKTHFPNVAIFNIQLSITLNTTKYKAKVVQSLNKLSHSNIKANLLGAQKSLNNANTETVSVAEIILPKRIVTSKGISNQINFRT